MPALSPVMHVKLPAVGDDTDVPASHLGKALTIKGRLDSLGAVHVDGRVLGQIAADRLVVGAGGYVEGDIVANDVRIGGRFTGRIFARHVTLDSSADITGRVFHHTVTVAKGARIDGRMPWRPLNYFERLEHLREAQS
ncbi:MAG: polymer-forming cytoskeletal protein [Alphaproteobacteria bacterium]|jgi:cytoskeletal protein CcmA (bactofilin family)|nr:polymer-forming cytoskeletal protein [Alphaproteobacteria bacterium]